MDDGSIGRLKPVESVAEVDQPSSAFNAACIEPGRYAMVGRLSVPSVVPEKKYGSAGYGRSPVVMLNFAVATVVGGGGKFGPSCEALQPTNVATASAINAGATSLVLTSSI